MHEAILAHQVVLAVRSAMEARGAASVKAIDLDLGELEGLSSEVLQAAFDLETEGTPLEGAILRVKLVPARAFCPSCNEERPLLRRSDQRHELPAVACPECGANLTLDSGRGVVVQRASMVVENP